MCSSGSVVSLYVPKVRGFPIPLGSRVTKISLDRGLCCLSLLMELGERAGDPRRLQSLRRVLAWGFSLFFLDVEESNFVKENYDRVSWLKGYLVLDSWSEVLEAEEKYFWSVFGASLREILLNVFPLRHKSSCSAAGLGYLFYWGCRIRQPGEGRYWPAWKVYGMILEHILGLSWTCPFLQLGWQVHEYHPWTEMGSHHLFFKGWHSPRKGWWNWRWNYAWERVRWIEHRDRHFDWPWGDC